MTGLSTSQRGSHIAVGLNFALVLSDIITCLEDGSFFPASGILLKYRHIFDLHIGKFVCP